jgi:hypothetical protein
MDEELDIERILDHMYRSLENSFRRTRIQRIIRDASHDFRIHIDYMNIILKKISNNLYEPCIKCKMRVNYKKNILCKCCRINLERFYFIKSTQNNITEKLPVEIIDLIGEFM